MSYKSLMKHRCSILRQDVDLSSGSPIYDWVVVKANVPCFLDLNFVRNGKDQMWTREAGRPTERAGVAFFLGSAPLKNGDWIKVTRGPAGVFELGGAVDEAWRPTNRHHIEVSVTEVPQAFAVGQTGAPSPAGDPVPTPDVPQSWEPGMPVPIPDPTDSGSL